ncbi:MAG TPA: FHA domain-containing protein [Bdellovibrionota bacterium]|nr:FHA domain-containing protein [Bdellovibrionota bacterium]
MKANAVIRYDHAQKLHEPKGYEARLHIVSGPEEGTTYQLVGKSINIGRQSDNDIVLKDLKASRHHVQIFFKDNRYVVKDLNSQNGVFINNQKVVESEIRSGDFVSMGNTVFKFVENIEVAIANNVFLQIKTPEKEENEKNWKTIAALIFVVAVTLIFIKVYFSQTELPFPEREPSAQTPLPQLSVFAPTREEIEREGEVTPENRDAAYVLYHKGYREFFAGNYERAIEHFRGCLGLFPRHELANIYLKKSFDNLDREIETRVNMGSIYLRALQYTEALREFERIVQILDFYPESRHYQKYYFDSKQYIQEIQTRLARETKGHY